MSRFQVPTRTRPPVDPEKLAQFASGAEITEPKNDKPAGRWDVLDDKKRSPVFSLRLTAKEQAGLKHISETTPNSMHEFCLKAIRKAIEEELKRQGAPF